MIDNINFSFDSDLDYILDSYAERIRFARFQVSSQLSHSMVRSKGNDYEFKLFLILGIVTLLLYPLSLVLTMSGVFAILGALLFILAAPCTLILFPVCVFKVIKHIVIKILNGHSDIAIYLKAKHGITTSGYEVDRLNELLIKYDAALSDIEIWKSRKEDGELELSEEEIRSKLERIDTNPNVDAVTDDSAFIALVRKITLVVCLIIFGIIFLILSNAYNNFMDTLTDMFRQV